jgi:hypothetical protein
MITRRDKVADYGIVDFTFLHTYVESTGFQCISDGSKD